jgi:hypothetical protein
MGPFNAPHAAFWTACHGVRCHAAVPVALVGECSIPSCRRWLASRAHRTASIADRSPDGASPRRRAQSQSTSPARCEGPTGRGHTRAESIRRSRPPHVRVGRVWSSMEKYSPPSVSMTRHCRSLSV